MMKKEDEDLENLTRTENIEYERERERENRKQPVTYLTFLCKWKRSGRDSERKILLGAYILKRHHVEDLVSVTDHYN